MELSLNAIFSDFNASKLLVYFCLLVFTMTYALRADSVINWPYYIIFAPLILWKLIAITGAIFGCISHCRQPPASNDYASELDYRTMLLCCGQHVLLLLFEILACYKLESGDTELKWMLVFVPLVFESVISIVVCVWSVRQERNIEFELFFSVNLLQFVFIALKLDRHLNWSWAVIFIPMWIIICLSLIAVLYAIILALLLIRSLELVPASRRQHMWSAVAYTLLVVPMLVFLVLLTGKLDAEELKRHDVTRLDHLQHVATTLTPSINETQIGDFTYMLVGTPLFVSLFCLMLMSCGARSGNQWWFGMRNDCCAFLFGVSPCMQQYGNISYKFGQHRQNVGTDETGEPAWRRRRQYSNNNNNNAIELGAAQSFIYNKDLKPSQPAVNLDLPD